MPEVEVELGGALIGSLRRPERLDAGVIGETWGLSEIGVGGKGRSKSSGLGQGDCERDGWSDLNECLVDDVMIVSTRGVLDPPSLLLLLVRIFVDTYIPVLLFVLLMLLYFCSLKGPYETVSAINS